MSDINHISLSNNSASKDSFKANWLRSAWPWIVCSVAAIFYCYEYLLRIAPGTMVEHLQLAFGSEGIPLDATQIGHLSAFYYYAYSPMQLPVGVMMDRYGPRWILTFAVLSCALGTLLFGSTNILSFAQFGRFLMGFGSAFAFVGVLKLASVWLPPDRFAFMAGLATALGMFGAMFGESLLTTLNQTLGWQQTIIYSAYVGFILIPIIWFIIRDKPIHSKDWSASDTKPSYRQLFMDIFLSFRNKQIWLNGLIGCFMMAPTVIFAELWGSLYLRTVHEFSIHTAPKAVAMVFLGWALGGPIMGYISDKIKRRRLPLMLGSLLSSICLALFVFLPNLTHTQINWLLFFTGFFSGAEVIVFAVGRENCHPRLAGTVFAVTNFVVVGCAIFQIIVGKILDYSWSGSVYEQAKVYNSSDYQLAMIVLPLCSLLAFFLCFFLKETYCRSQPEE
jgi:MFS family permease